MAIFKALMNAYIKMFNSAGPIISADTLNIILAAALVIVVDLILLIKSCNFINGILKSTTLGISVSSKCL